MKAGVDAYSEALTAGSSKMLAFGAGAKAMIASLMPLIGVLAAIGIAFAGFKAFDYFNTGWTRAQESAQKAVSEFDDAKTKLESLNEEKNDNLSKVQEIAAKYDIQVDGMDDVDEMIEKIKSSDKGITLVDQVELDKLSTANKQLEAQAKVQEQIVEAKRQASIAETEAAAQTEKSYWEQVKERHGKGILGTIASAWDYINSRGGGARIDENGKIVDVEAEGERWAQQDTTNIGMAQKAYDDLIAKKQELQQLNQEIENSKGGVTDEQIKRHEDLTKEIAEQASKAGTLMNTVSSELDVLSQSDSKFAKDYVKQAKQLLLDFTNIDASPAEVALNTINSFFDGTFGKNAIKEELIDAMESGQDLEETLQGLGLSMDDFGNIDISYLTDYFEDITKSAEEAKDTVDNFHVSIDDVSEATKSANKDADWSTMQSAYKAAGELLKEGKTGTDDFQTVAQFFTDKNLQKLAKEAKDAGGYAADVYQEAFENAQKQADRWFGEDETKSMENFVDDMSDKGLFNVNKNDEKGLWAIESQFKTTAEAAKELGTSTEVVETMLSALESYGYDFSGIEKSGEMLSEYQQTLEALKQTYDSMDEGEAKDKLGKLIEGFDEEYKGFQDDLSSLTEEQIVHIKFEYDLASIQSKIDEIQELINSGMGDDVETNAQLIAANNQYIKTAEKGLGLGQEGIQLPVQYVVADNTEASLREQLKEATPEEKVGIQTKIENQQQIKKDILDTFADEHPEITPEANVDEINSALADTFGEKTIVFKASVDGVEQAVRAHQNEDGTITYTANVDGVQTEVQQVQNEDGTITYTASVENEPKGDDLNKKGTVEYEAKVNDSGVTKDKSAKVSFTKDSTAADNYKPGDKQAKVIFGKDSSIPDNYSPSDKRATVHYSANTSNLPSHFDTITRYVNYVKTGNGAVDGTAHARGTAFSRGTARKGVAFARGNWGTRSAGTALVGEEGNEIVVRQGRFFTIGDNGAEFFKYQRGDIIFNHSQAEQLLENGKITHGKRRGKALAEGTAFRLGSGSSGSSSSSKSSSKKKSSSSKKSSGKKSSSNSKSSSKDKQTVDWIEIDIKRAERDIANLKAAAENAYDTFSSRNANLNNEISAVTSEISLQQKAYNGYIKAANKVGLKASLKSKVQNGTIEISKYDADTQKKIKEYQDLYEKALKSKDAISELGITISKLYKQRFENTLKSWANALQTVEHNAERVEKRIDNRTNKASDYILPSNKENASNSNINDYRLLISNYETQIANKTSEIAQLTSMLNSAVSAGAVKSGSEEYYSMLKEIQSVQKEIDELNGDIIDTTNNIAKEYRNLFDLISTNTENSLSLIDDFATAYNNKLSLAEAKGLTTSANYYKALLDIESQNVNISKKLAEDLQKSLNNSIASGSISVGSQAWYEMTNRINEAKTAIDEAATSMQEYNNQIRQIAWDRFDMLQDEISEVIDESEFLIELMSKSDLYDESGKINEVGRATLGLYTMNYNVYTNQVKQYADEIAKINEQLANDPNNTTIIQRRKELIEAQRDAILASQKEKESIKSLVEDGIKAEISYMDDLIDKYLDALNSQKDLYDYQKKIKDQTGKIASLQKQLSSYSGDNSEESKKRMQEIEVSLKEARENLQDTKYNKYISDSKKMLSDLKDDYEKTMNARLDDLDGLISEISDDVNLNHGDIKRTLEEQSNNVGYTISDSIDSVWSSAESIMTATTTSLDNIYYAVVKLWNYADAQASSDVSSINKSNDDKNQQESQATKEAQAAALASKSTASKPANQTPSTTASKQSTTATTTAQNGWVQTGGNWFYYKNGKKQTGWQTVGGKKYYMSTSDGHMLEGVQKIGNKYYYFYKSTTSSHKEGQLSEAANMMVEQDGYKYYFKNGEMQTGWHKMKEGKRYFSVLNGRMLTGLQTIGKKKYYLDPNTGVLKTGKFKVGLRQYEADKNGVLKKYARGSRNINKDQFGWTNEAGQELIYRSNTGALLTPLSSGDKVFTASMADKLWEMSKPNGIESLISGIKHGNIISDGYDGLRRNPMSTSHSNVENNFDNITFSLPNVNDYQSFMREIQNDKNFEKLIQAMTIGRINGKPKDMKRHIQF